ncbi:MAG: hypothetical protein LBT38_11290 [Deltaproteobacteria bacterium]|nr:hypothetical protein [Deltaproteobacteria bacterium]
MTIIKFQRELNEFFGLAHPQYLMETPKLFQLVADKALAKDQFLLEPLFYYLESLAKAGQLEATNPLETFYGSIIVTNNSRPKAQPLIGLKFLGLSDLGVHWLLLAAKNGHMDTERLILLILSLKENLEENLAENNHQYQKPFRKYSLKNLKYAISQAKDSLTRLYSLAHNLKEALAIFLKAWPWAGQETEASHLPAKRLLGELFLRLANSIANLASLATARVNLYAYRRSNG